MTRQKSPDKKKLVYKRLRSCLSRIPGDKKKREKRCKVIHAERRSLNFFSSSPSFPPPFSTRSFVEIESLSLSRFFFPTIPHHIVQPLTTWKESKIRGMERKLCSQCFHHFPFFLIWFALFVQDRGGFFALILRKYTCEISLYNIARANMEPKMPPPK